MLFQSHDISHIVSIAQGIGLACMVVIGTPIAYSTLMPDEYLPLIGLPAEALLVTYALLGVVIWHGWRKGGIDRITCLAIAAFWAINAFLFGTYWIAENYQYAAAFGSAVGAVSAPLLFALVRATLSCERNMGLRLSLRAILGQRRFTERPPRRITGWRSFWHYLEFTVVLLAAVRWMIYVEDFLDQSSFRHNAMAGSIKYGLVIPIFIYAFNRKRVAEQLRALSIEESTGRERRAPILFLRSFADDEIHVERSLSLLTGGRIPLECPLLDPKFWGRMVRYEEIIAKALWEIGPVVAIGAPSEEIPQLGAIRSYYADTSWQSKVTELMHRARLILMIPSGSRSVQWEIETLRQSGLMKKVIFMLPPSKLTKKTERWKSMMCAIDTDWDVEPLQGFDPNVRAMVVCDNMCAALRSTEMDDMVLTLVAKGAADLALRGHCA